MGVVVVKQNFQRTTTTEIPFANGLLTHEQALTRAGLSLNSCDS
jgi:hypothetical protein